jgi:hypothetical protein
MTPISKLDMLLDTVFIELLTKISNECSGLPDNKADLVRFLLECSFDGQPEAVKQCAAQHLAHAIDLVKCYQSQHWRN